MFECILASLDDHVDSEREAFRVSLGVCRSVCEENACAASANGKGAFEELNVDTCVQSVETGAGKVGVARTRSQTLFHCQVSKKGDGCRNGEGEGDVGRIPPRWRRE